MSQIWRPLPADYPCERVTCGCATKTPNHKADPDCEACAGHGEYYLYRRRSHFLTDEADEA